MPLDLLATCVGFVSFGIFLIIHVVSFRWLRPEELLKSLSACIVAVAVLPLLLTAMLFFMKVTHASLAQWILSAVLALGVAGLLSLVYVLCVFGPTETSIRMRLVREIAKNHPEKISHQELLERYNTQTIIKVRLRRLKGSGDIIEQEGRYVAGNGSNIFFLFDVLARMIKKWID